MKFGFEPKEIPSVSQQELCFLLFLCEVGMFYHWEILEDIGGLEGLCPTYCAFSLIMVLYPHRELD